ncbi:MAG: hypothetical protein LCH63_13635 [Candidatus Melainabacteria bacterium]|nr:hypothetical protein [Candidatus Melainabacteria bacterium]
MKSNRAIKFAFSLTCCFIALSLGYLFAELRQKSPRQIVSQAVSIFGGEKLKPYIKPTVAMQIEQYGQATRERLQNQFSAIGKTYPPDTVAFVALKNIKALQVYAKGKEDSFYHVCTYPILGASGYLGPKLKEGDRQVPEGIYKLTLEPDTPYHLALRLNYPNQSDWARAKADGRESPGSDILIHGNTGSIGCLAMGDIVAEDLFVLVHDTKEKTANLVIAPVDFRSEEAPTIDAPPPWLPELYDEIRSALSKFPKPGLSRAL